MSSVRFTVPAAAPATRRSRRRASSRHRSPARPATPDAAGAVGVPATLVLTLALMSSPALAPHAVAAPLSDAEGMRADALAHTVPWTEASAAARGVARRTAERQGGTTGRAGPHPLGVQTLLVEHEPRKGAVDGARRARVYQHDHGAGLTRLVLVDLAREAVVRARPLDSPHLPLNEAERRWALTRLAAADALLERLREEQRRRGRPPFADLGELDVKASVFEPTGTAHRCTRERCALLSLFDATRTVFALEPVVRFADGSIEAPGTR